MTQEILASALNLTAYGLSVVPIKTDGSKSPALDSWKEYQEMPAERSTLERWFPNGRAGIGIICGKVSGGLEVIDLETPAIAQKWRSTAIECGGKDVIDRLLAVKTPNGFHCYYRCEQPGRNADLALRPPTDAELAENPKRKYYKLIETRAEGGYVVAPGSPSACHPSGRLYELVRGDFSKIPVITMEERELLLDCARSLNEYHKARELADPSTVDSESESGRPGDLFNERATWAEVLEPSGWRKSKADPHRWIRPGGSRDSALEILDGTRLWVFSSSVTELPFEKAISKYAAYAFLNCQGSFTQATKQLAEKGYAPEPTKPAQSNDEEAEPEFNVRDWPVLPPEALHGLAGRFVAAATESSEADPAAVLAAFLVRAAAAFGPHAWLKIADDKHYPRLFAAVVGASSNARKGTSLGPVRRVFEAAEERLSTPPLNVVRGLSSGEGVIGAVRNKGEKQGDEPAAEEVEDKRLFVEESEFGGALKAMQRPGNTLSPVVRTAWDQSDLGILTRKDPLKATGTHICILGQITRRELAELFERVELSNGLANRFLWFCARKSKSLCFPQGIPDDQVPILARELAEAIKHAQVDRIMNLDSTAAAAWRELYEEVTKEVGGVVGDVTARGPAQILRLSLIYSLLDRDDMIRVHHLQAALAVWEYCLGSAKYIFSSTYGSGSSAESLTARILDELATGGRTQKDLYVKFRNTTQAKQLASALAELQAIGRITQTKGVSIGGRTPTVWSLVPKGDSNGIA